MVSQHETAPGTTTVVTDDRGIREQSTYGYGAAYTPGHVPSLVGRYHSFWGSVVAGTVAAISLSVLSYALMFAVGISQNNPTGNPDFGWGAVIWSALTAAIAFFIGGLVASVLMPLDRHGWVHGFTVWALSVPVTLVLTSFVAMGVALTYGPYGGSPAATGHVRIGFMPTIIQLSSGAAWMLFISLASGLLFAIFGGLAGGNRDMIENKVEGHRDRSSELNCPPGTSVRS
jgi:hypothetical protein